MKKLLFIAATIFLLPFIGMKGTPAGNPSASKAPSPSENINSQAVYQPHYISPTPGKFPIIASSPVSDNRIPTKSDFEIMKACGFNAAMTIFNTSRYLPLMSKIKDLDLTLLPIFDNYTSLNARNTIEKIREYMTDNDIPYSMIGGYRVKDEPHYSNIEIINDLHIAIKDADPDVMPFVNLAAQPNEGFRPNAPQHSYSSDSTARSNMSAYFKHFYEIVHPDVWSYDYYPFVYDSRDEQIHVNYEDFYYNLQLFAGMSKKTGIPFWAYCQSTNVEFITIGNPNYTAHPKAKEKFLRYEAFNALAFGAKAITYWRYSYREDAPHSDAEGTYYEHYISSLTDARGFPTNEWKNARIVNNEIRRHEDLFINSELQSYSLLGDTAMLLGEKRYVRPTDSLCAKFPEYDGPVKVQVDSGPGILVSKLKHGDRLVTFIVNQSPYVPTKVELSFRDIEIQNTIIESEQAVCLDKQFDLSGIPVNNDSDPNRMQYDSIVEIYYPISTKKYRLKPAGYIIYEYDYKPIKNKSKYNGGYGQISIQDVIAIRRKYDGLSS